MKQFVQLCLIIFLLYYIHYTKSDGNSDSIRYHLGSRTPYRYRYNKNYTTMKYPNCKDTKLWMVIRHGTRLPSRKDITGMNTTLKDLKFRILLQHQLGKGELNKEQLQRIEEWSSSIDIDHANDLTLEGQDEMHLLAKRMQQRLPNIIRKKYDNETFMFRYTATQRAQESAKHFSIGLFNKMDVERVMSGEATKFRYTATQRAQESAKHFSIGLFNKMDVERVMSGEATKVDTVLRFYEHCDRWQKQVKKNPATYEEQRLFSVSDQMSETLHAITNKLGLDKVISLDTVKLMYKVCGFETSWHKHELSPWCYAFDNNSIEVLEYYFDLKHYWKDGYGHNFTYRQACLGVKHMFETFTKKKGPVATFLFTHSGTILKILAHMGLYKTPKPLRGDAVDKDRVWKTSKIDCFASNLAFVLFECEDGYKVLTLHQERVVILPMCENELCPLKHLQEYFDESINNCDYKDMCSLNQKDEL